MPITLRLNGVTGALDTFRVSDDALREVLGRRESEPATAHLLGYIVERLASERSVEPAGHEDREVVLRLVAHWIEGVAGIEDTIRVVPLSVRGDRSSGAGSRLDRNQTFRDALLSRRQPTLLVYPNHLDARSYSRDLAQELDLSLYWWTRAGGWDRPLPDGNDQSRNLTERHPVIAIGEALQAIENGTLPRQSILAYQDLVWDVDGDNQVLATGLPSLWDQVRTIEGGLILAMPTEALPPSWAGLFQIIRLRTGSSPTPLLDRFGRDITARARDGLIQPIAGRRDERAAVLNALRRAPGAASGVLLYGPRGVGKSALLEQLALDLNDPAIDSKLRGKRLILIDVADLLAGTANRGDLEGRVSQLIQEAAENNDSTILAIDEIHRLASPDAGAALEALKEPLARGRIRVIGASTPADWSPVERTQEAFASRFTKIHLAEPTLPEVVQAMEAHLPVLARHHEGVKILRPDLQFIAEAVTRYMASQPLPRTPITMLYDLAALAEAQGYGQITQPMVWNTISRSVGAPIGPVSDEEAATLLRVESEINATILGQEEAAQLVAEAVLAHRVRKSRHRPSFLLFIGPSGVGKTETARIINRVLVPGRELLEFNMEQFHDRHTGARLLGAPPGYVMSEEGSILVTEAQESPYRVVLLDEIEKAHPEVIKQLMNLINTGIYRDPRGLVGDFRRWVFIATSNLLVDPGLLSLPLRELIPEVVREFGLRGVPPEVVGRVGSLGPFRPLTLPVLERIAERKLRAFADEVAAEGYGSVSWAPAVPQLLARLAHGSPLGARALDQQLDPLLNRAAAGSIAPGGAGRSMVLRVIEGELHLGRE